MGYKYFTEILLLTRSYYPEELQSWIVWYLDILKILSIDSNLFANSTYIIAKAIKAKYVIA